MLGPKSTVGNGLVKQKGPCGRSLGLRKAGDKKALKKHMPRSTDVIWKSHEGNDNIRDVTSEAFFQQCGEWSPSLQV